MPKRVTGPGLCGISVPCCQGDYDGENCTTDCNCYRLLARLAQWLYSIRQKLR